MSSPWADFSAGQFFASLLSEGSRLCCWTLWGHWPFSEKKGTRITTSTEVCFKCFATKLMEDNTYVKLQVQSPVLPPFCDSLKEFPVVLIIILQGLDLSLMLVEKLFSEIICKKKTCSKTHTPFMTTTYIQRLHHCMALFTSMIWNKSLLLLFAVEASLPKKCNLSSDGLNDTFHAVHFQHLQTLDLSLELKRQNAHY